jgi:hypothetical protein
MFNKTIVEYIIPGRYLACTRLTARVVTARPALSNAWSCAFLFAPKVAINTYSGVAVLYLRQTLLCLCHSTGQAVSYRFSIPFSVRNPGLDGRICVERARD